jgi:hypothetical protein
MPVEEVHHKVKGDIIKYTSFRARVLTVASRHTNQKRLVLFLVARMSSMGYCP